MILILLTAFHKFAMSTDRMITPCTHPKIRYHHQPQGLAPNENEKNLHTWPHIMVVKAAGEQDHCIVTIPVSVTLAVHLVESTSQSIT